jgi:hypothetical protein
MVPVSIVVKGKTTIVTEDEEYQKINFDKVSSLKPAFDKNGRSLLVVLPHLLEEPSLPPTPLL